MKILELMAQFVLMIAAGFILCRLGSLKDEARHFLSNLILDLLLPCNVVVSFANSAVNRGAFASMPGVLMGSIGYTVLAFALNRFLYRRYSEDEQASLKYSTMIPNCAFLGAGVCESVYGSTGMILSSVYQIPERIAVWVFAPLYFDKNSGQSVGGALKKLASTPCVIAVIIGLALFFSGIEIPDMLLIPLQKLGNCSTPLSMVMIGMIFSKVRLGDLANGKVLYFCFLRLVAIPLMVLALCLPFERALTPMGMNVIVLMAALPGGTVSALLASRYGKAEQFATHCLILSTLLSCFTLPCWIYALTKI